MDCGLADEVFWLWHASKSPELTEHIQQCASCRQIVEETEDFDEEFAKLLAFPDPKAPEQIGEYHILCPLGDGHMGAVYLAEKDGPIRPLVAIKVMHLEAGSELQRSFEREGQILSRLHHRSVARVFDTGLTENGAPYMIMEYVPGCPITEYCEQKQLKIRERLKLFLELCEAVQYCHLKGIIHRDLKPDHARVVSADGIPLRANEA